MDITKTPTTAAPVLALDVENIMADTLVKITDDLSGWYDVSSRVGSVQVTNFVDESYLHGEYAAAQKAVGLFEDPANLSKTRRGQLIIQSTFGKASLAFTKAT